MRRKVETIVRRLKGYLRGEISHLGSQPRNAFRILISTILSQRTRDENTAHATDKLFEVYPDAYSLSAAPLGKIEKLIKKAGFYKTKAKRLKEVATAIVEKFGGKVPKNREEMEKLPGVGPKTSGCVAIYAFGKDAIPVDTHVHRISNRLGWVKTRTPEETEKELERIVPRRYWQSINELFVLYGQMVCKPVKPLCERCVIKRYCNYWKTVASKKK
ncbi:endonuclease III [Candidatus Micrarchaeota archaeon]|nr:endonuclease III [Candidatus Micrarchaeota archaeon]